MTAPRTQGPHFLVGAGELATPQTVLVGDDARHLLRVLRAQIGDPVSVADGAGVLAQTRVRQLDESAVELEVESRYDVPAPTPAVTVVHALPKGRKLDEVVQRLSEIGVDRLVPVHTERSQVELTGDRAAKALRRWRAVAHAAAKQSRRVRPLEIAEPGEWASALAGARGVVLCVEAPRSLSDVLAEEPSSTTVTLAIGPEGGLTDAEVAGCPLEPAHLGATVLRTETAGLVAASLVLAARGRLG